MNQTLQTNSWVGRVSLSSRFTMSTIYTPLSISMSDLSAKVTTWSLCVNVPVVYSAALVYITSPNKALCFTSSLQGQLEGAEFNTPSIYPYLLCVYTLYMYTYKLHYDMYMYMYTRHYLGILSAMYFVILKHTQ